VGERPGNCVTQKAGRNHDRDGTPTKGFEPSLFVWATVMSRPAEDRAIVDAGLKALAFDSGPPLVCNEPPRCAFAAATNRLHIGDKIRPISASAFSIQSCHRPLQAAEVALPAIVRALVIGLVFGPEARLLHAYENTPLVGVSVQVTTVFSPSAASSPDAFQL